MMSREEAAATKPTSPKKLPRTLSLRETPPTATDDPTEAFAFRGAYTLIRKPSVGSSLKNIVATSTSPSPTNG
jgi:hypothetical protein